MNTSARIYFLPATELPKGFHYPESFSSFVNTQISNIDPWRFLYLSNEHENINKGLKKRYQTRILVPFARRKDNDDIACFDGADTSSEPKVLIIHDFASPGWENRGECKDFTEWLKLAEAESTDWKNQ